MEESCTARRSWICFARVLFPGGVYVQCHVEIGSVKNSKHDNLRKVRREQEKFGLLGGCVPVTKVQVVSF